MTQLKLNMNDVKSQLNKVIEGKNDYIDSTIDLIVFLLFKVGTFQISYRLQFLFSMHSTSLSSGDVPAACNPYCSSSAR